jgi:hypothetical protein
MHGTTNIKLQKFSLLRTAHDQKKKVFTVNIQNDAENLNHLFCVLKLQSRGK